MDASLKRFWVYVLPDWIGRLNHTLAASLYDGFNIERPKYASSYIATLLFILVFFSPRYWPGLDIVYTESFWFMAFLIAVSSYLGTWGGLSWLAYLGGDLFHNASRFIKDGPVNALGSVTCKYILLFQLLVLFPHIVHGLFRNQPIRLRLGLVPIVHAAVVWFWCEAMIVLIRPVFILLDTEPSYSSVETVQINGVWLAIVAAFAIGLREYLSFSNPNRLRINVVLTVSYWEKLPFWVSSLMNILVLALLLSGFYDSWIDLLLTLVFLISVEGLRIAYRRLPNLANRIDRLPMFVRYLSVLLIGFCVSWVLIEKLPLKNSFKPMLLGTVFTLLLFYFLFPSTSKRETE